MRVVGGAKWGIDQAFIDERATTSLPQKRIMYCQKEYSDAIFLFYCVIDVCFCVNVSC